MVEVQGTQGQTHPQECHKEGCRADGANNGADGYFFTGRGTQDIAVTGLPSGGHHIAGGLHHKIHMEYALHQSTQGIQVRALPAMQSPIEGQ